MERLSLKNEGLSGQIEDESIFSCSSSELFSSETSGIEGHSDVSSCLWPSSEGDLSEMELVKERLSKLLLGEDMSGSGNGVQTALAISNAITNLSASVFGQMWRLEPLQKLKKSTWRRELECLLCVTDYIVELKPDWHTYPDGTKVEVMSSGPRHDLAVNLPALRKLDSMLLDILEYFTNTEFWYVEKGLSSADGEVLALFRSSQRQEGKWWLPIPQVPPRGLSEYSRKMLQIKREGTNQILKAVTAINNMTLADMEVPESYLDELPKHGRDCLGDAMYRYMSSNNFSPERLFAYLGISSEYEALETVNQVEAAIVVFRKRATMKDFKRNNSYSSSSYSWAMVKDLALDSEKRDLIADNADIFLLALKQKFPGLPQSALETSKIHHNKDIGKAILESYSRVLESLAFNILARIDDVLSMDEMTRQSDQKSKSFLPKLCSFGHGLFQEGLTSGPVPKTANKKTLAEIMASRKSTCDGSELISFQMER